MKNPYLYGYLPLFSTILFSLSFGIYTVGVALNIFTSIGLYAGMREFLSDMELRVLLLVIFSFFYFMFFSALKLIGETIHELGMLFFSKDQEGITISVARGGYVIFFFGSLVSLFAIPSFFALATLFGITVIIYFIYKVYKLSQSMTFAGTVGLIFFEIMFWTVFVTVFIYVIMKLYNGILASLPFAN